MTDASGKDLRNRAVVLFVSNQTDRLRYGIIQDIRQNTVRLLGIDLQTQIEYPESMLGELTPLLLIQIKRDQIPLAIKDRLVELNELKTITNGRL